MVFSKKLLIYFLNLKLQVNQNPKEDVHIKNKIKIIPKEQTLIKKDPIITALVIKILEKEAMRIGILIKKIVNKFLKV